MDFSTNSNKDIVLVNPYFDSKTKCKIRIQSIEINDFKGVKHGVVNLFNRKSQSIQDEEPNILGLYGQNGSGKTTVVEVIQIVKMILLGYSLPDNIYRCISQGTDQSNIKICFEVRRNNTDNIDYLTYSFSLKEKKDEVGVIIDDELLTIATQNSSGKIIAKTHKLFDTKSNDSILNCSVISVLTEDINVTDSPKKIITLDIRDTKERCLNSCKSVIFGSDEITMMTRANFTEEENYYEHEEFAVIEGSPYQYIFELADYARNCLLIAGANLLNEYEDGAIPIHFRNGYVQIYNNYKTTVYFNDFDDLNKSLEKLNKVLSVVIPGLEVSYFTEDNVPALMKSYQKEWNKLKKQMDKELDDKGEITFPYPGSEKLPQNYFNIEFTTKRGDVEIPIENESEGIKRIIYALDLFVAAYNNPNFTVVIDEFDAGIFEFLLGELLKIFEQRGKGQFIFTSHNLRPLEVINRKFICFTTTNQDNRYIRLKYINQTNNLRDVYFRQIMVGEQDEDVYNYVNTYDLIEALEKAGDE